LNKGRGTLRIERVESMGKGAQGDGVESEPGKIVDDINALVAKTMPLYRQVGHLTIRVRYTHLCYEL
jgi:hypothetical protein